MTTRIISTLAASLVLGAVGTLAASAAPAMPQAGLIAGGAVATVDWHPSTRHWDHHFHSHQNAYPHDRPIVVERGVRYGGWYARNPEWSGYGRPYGTARSRPRY